MSWTTVSVAGGGAAAGDVEEEGDPAKIKIEI